MRDVCFNLLQYRNGVTYQKDIDMSNAKTIKQRWSTALKSGVNATVIVRDSIAHCNEHGDTSLLSTMIFAADKGGMDAYGKKLRLIIKAVYPAASIRKNKAGEYSITRGNDYSDASFIALEACVNEGFSLIGPKLAEVFGVSKPEQSIDEQITARAKAQAKWIVAQEQVQLEQYINQLREQYKQAVALKIKNVA